MLSKEDLEQRKAYLEHADVVARELDGLTNVSIRTLGYLEEMAPDAKLLDAIQRKSNEDPRASAAVANIMGAALG